MNIEILERINKCFHMRKQLENELQLFQIDYLEDYETELVELYKMLLKETEEVQNEALNMFE